MMTRLNPDEHDFEGFEVIPDDFYPSYSDQQPGMVQNFLQGAKTRFTNLYFKVQSQTFEVKSLNIPSTPTILLGRNIKKEEEFSEIYKSVIFFSYKSFTMPLVDPDSKKKYYNDTRKLGQ